MYITNDNFIEEKLLFVMKRSYNDLFELITVYLVGWNQYLKKTTKCEHNMFGTIFYYRSRSLYV